VRAIKVNKVILQNFVSITKKIRPMYERQLILSIFKGGRGIIYILQAVHE